ncbi:MAG: sorbosone dehydrogenase family protein, partial [Pirellulaceae bacterium]
MSVVCCAQKSGPIAAPGWFALGPERSLPRVAVALATLIAGLASRECRADEVGRPFGLDRRVPLATSRFQGSPEPPAPYRVERRFPQLQFHDPVVLTDAPGTDRLFLVEVTGKIYSFPAADDKVAQADLCVDLKTGLEKVDQVYGLTFHPRFATNREAFICYRVASDVPDGTRVSRFLVSREDPPRIDPASEQVVITWRGGGHNGGCLAFGPDGYLYVSSGDGGPAFPPDPLQSGQDVSTLLSAVLRIDVDHPAADHPYSIPSDNPFVGLAGARGEIWAYGFRNPWKISFDARTGALWAGDVGWELWEMIYRVEKGGNYGWSLVEASQPVHRERPRGPTPIVPPTVAHSHIEARSITGGNVYRGERLEDLVGSYIYGDYVTGKLWAYNPEVDLPGKPRELADTALPIVCFGVDCRQELYIVSYDGTLHGLEKNTAAVANAAFPTRLSETGLFESVPDHVLAPGVLPYGIKAEPWMDGAHAQRSIALPGTSSLGIFPSSNVQIGFIKDTWSFPNNAVLMKTISLELQAGRPASARRLETQILHYDVDTWRAYNYIWNDDQTDAVLAPDQAAQRTFEVQDERAPGGRRSQTWHFASRTECLLCHTTRGGTVYGFNPPQLDRDFDYGGGRVNQLRSLGHIGLFSEVAKEPAYVMVDPYDETAALEQRARAYLHVNCA